MEINLAGNLYQELQEVHQENALKLKQILDLEEILYATAVMEMIDGSPCWCILDDHEKFCEDARNATKHLWSK